MTGPEAAAFHAHVRGRVQGVGFRYSAIHEARRLGLRGMVRNCGDGSVEVVAEGSAPSIAEFRAWLSKGPPGAFVREVEAVDVPPTGGYAGFEVEF